MLKCSMAALQRRKRQAEQRRAAMVVHKPKAPPLVRMEELRALNMIQLDPDDAKAKGPDSDKADRVDAAEPARGE